MSKFVGGLITGSVLTLVGLGIAAAISDGTLLNSFDDLDLTCRDENKERKAQKDEVDSDDEVEDTKKEEYETSIGDHLVKRSEKFGGILGKGVGAIIDAVETRTESFEEAISEKSDDSVENNSTDKGK